MGIYPNTGMYYTVGTCVHDNTIINFYFFSVCACLSRALVHRLYFKQLRGRKLPLKERKFDEVRVRTVPTDMIGGDNWAKVALVS